MKIIITPVETGGRRLQSPQIFAKVDLLPIDNDSEKKDEARPCNVIPVMNKTNFDWRCIFYRASFFNFYHDDYHLEGP